MSLLRSKDASLVAAPGTGDVGGFGVEVLGGDHDLVVGAALSLVTCDDITVTEVPEAGWYELSFPGLKYSVGAKPCDREDVAVNETGFTIVPAHENLVARAEFDGSWQRDSEFLGVSAGIDRTVVTLQPQPASLNALNRERLAALNGTNPCVEGDHHTPAVVGGVTLLLDGPVQLFVDGDGSPMPEEFPLLETLADGLRESAVLFPGRGNSDAAIELSAAVGGFEVGLGRLPDVLTTPLLDPAQGVELHDTPEGVAPRHGADGSVVLLHLLPADILQLGPAEVGVLIEDAQEVSGFNGNVLADVADEQDASIAELSNAQERGAHFDRLQARLVDDDNRTSEVCLVRLVREEVVNGGGVGEA